MAHKKSVNNPAVHIVVKPCIYSKCRKEFVSYEGESYCPECNAINQDAIKENFRARKNNSSKRAGKKRDSYYD